MKMKWSYEVLELFEMALGDEKAFGPTHLVVKWLLYPCSSGENDVVRWHDETHPCM